MGREFQFVEQLIVFEQQFQFFFFLIIIKRRFDGQRVAEQL